MPKNVKLQMRNKKLLLGLIICFFGLFASAYLETKTRTLTIPANKAILNTR